MTPRAKAELLRTLDEKFISNSVAFDTMQVTGTMVLEGSSLRTPDGRLDRAAILERVERATWTMPAMRQRLVYTPFRLTTPAWVPVRELDITRHVVFHDTVEPDDPRQVEVISGRRFGPMDPDRPLWEVHIIELASGRVALTVRVHHVMGDGQFASGVGFALTRTTPMTALPEITEHDVELVGRPPRHGLELLAIVGQAWWRQQGSLGAAWREYWRKPFVARLRRWGGRILRPARNAAIARSGRAASLAVPRHSRLLTLDLAAITEHARSVGGSLNDLTVAVAVKAAGIALSGRPLSLMVPVSRRRPEDARNHISMVKVTADPDAELGDIVRVVGQQIRASVIGKSPDPAASPDASGYATFMRWGRSPRFFGDSPVEEALLWPAGDPGDEIGFLACSYGNNLALTITSATSIDIDAVLDSVTVSLTTNEPTKGR